MIFPKEQKSQVSAGKYKLKKNYCKYKLVDFFNLIKDGNEDVSVVKNALLDKEEYILSVKPEGIDIAASTHEGIYRAATSLLQMIRRQGDELGAVEIQDKPQFPRRGYMLDISRGKKPRLETIKQLVDFLSGLKYNEFQLYMEAECFDYSAYPQYTRDFECLTPQDIRELDEYCAERFVDLVANQNSLGHMENWLKHDELKHLGLCAQGEAADTINPLEPESLEVLDKIYDSLLPHFRSEYVNIGLDEAYGLGKYQMAEYTAEHGKDIAFMEWLNKLNDIIKKKHNKKVMFWSDMIYKSEKLYGMIPKDAIILEWGYELIQSQIMTEHAITFKNAGLDYYVCPSCNTHNSFTGRFDVTSFNIRTSAEIGARHGARGMLLTDWGNGGHPQFGVWSLIPAALMGQYAWNIGAEQDGETFKADFIRAAEDYVDETVFGGAKIARLMYRMANYYLLEPERVHVGTMCGEILSRPISQTNFEHFFDLKDCGDDFYFNNVTEYVSKILADFEKADFDPQMKREIVLGGKMVILSSEICKLRIGSKMTKDQLDGLIDLADWIIPEYRALWLKRNYEKGVELYESVLKQRRAELVELKNSIN